MRECRTLLVDLDGTLLGSAGLSLRLETMWRAHRYWRKLLPRPVTFGKTFRAFKAMKAALESGPSDRTNFARVVEAFASVFGLPEETAREELERSFLAIFPSLKHRFYPIPGAASFVDWARGKYRLILATNPMWLLEIVDCRVRWAGMDPSVFPVRTHAKRMHYCKPSVGYYEELLREERLDPATCLLIGNDRRKDGPATQAGIATFLLSRSSTPRAVADSGGGAAPVWTGNYSALRSLLSAKEVRC